MKARGLFIAELVFLIGLSEVCLGIENYVGPATVPPSSVRDGLVSSSRLVDTGGNAAMTGDLVGGRYFRRLGAILPYGSASVFGAARPTFRMGTASPILDSFLRRSADSENAGFYTRRYEAYYSPSGTGTAASPGLIGVVRPPTTKIGSRGADRVTLASLSKEQGLFSQGLLASQEEASSSGFDVTPFMPQEMEKTILDEASIKVQGIKLPKAELQRAGMKWAPESFLRSEVAIRDIQKSPLFSENREMESELESARRAAGQQLQQTPLEAEEIAELQLLEELTDQAGSSSWLQSGEALKTAISQLQESRQEDDQMGARQGNGGLDLRKPMGEFDLPDVRRPARFSGDEFVFAETGADERALRKQDELAGFGSYSATGGGVGAVADAKRGVLSPDVYEQMKQHIDSLRKGFSGSYPVGSESMGEISGISLEQRAKAILGPHKSFASFSEAKFNQHIEAGREYLRQGMYYRAADAYSLASVYEPEDPASYGGRSHALFAAGEYMSSALFLSKTLETFSEYEKTLEAKDEGLKTAELDVLAFLAESFTLIDRDKLEDRIVDIEEWQQRSDSPELQFLLGYIYYQMGRGERAKEAVGEAYDRMPEAPAVVILKKAIDSHEKSGKGGDSGEAP